MGRPTPTLAQKIGWRRKESLLRAKVLGLLWRLRHRVEPLAPDAAVTFAIPLIGRASAGDWGTVNERIAVTLGALLRQTDPRWQAVICGQDRPEALPDDPRVRFLRYPRPVSPGTVTDKYDKIPFILDSLSQDPPRDGYLFLLDADDILHPGLVAHMLTEAAPGGYLIEAGHMMDVSTGEIADLGAPDDRHKGRQPFWLHCGSCAAIRADRSRWANWRTPIACKGQHLWQAENLRAFGIDLATVPFPAAIYVVNHGENTRQRRGRMGSKLAYLTREKRDPGAAAEILAAFGLAPPEATASRTR